MTRKEYLPNRRDVLAGFGAHMVLVSPIIAQDAKQFPPIPTWTPTFTPDVDLVAERFRFYFGGKYDFVVFQHTTCCAIPLGLSDDDAQSAATEILDKIIGFHPDMNPQTMRDGNVLVSYNHPAVNIVPHQFARKNWEEIEDNHLKGLTPGEVLVTPLGANQFDDLGKMALLGRSYMFLDAISPDAVRIDRAG